MKKNILCSVFLVMFSFASVSYAEHTTAVESNNDFQTTVQKTLKAIKKNKGVSVFAVIEHSENAKKTGGEDFGKSTLIIFGNPKNGSKFMKQYPQAAIDLPLKVLIYETNGKVYFSYVNPTDIASNYKGAEKHPFIKNTQEMLGNLAKKVTE